MTRAERLARYTERREIMAGATCPVCAASLSRSRVRTYCSSACRDRAANERRKAERKVARAVRRADELRADVEATLQRHG